MWFIYFLLDIYFSKILENLMVFSNYQMSFNLELRKKNKKKFPSHDNSSKRIL